MKVVYNEYSELSRHVTTLFIISTQKRPIFLTRVEQDDTISNTKVNIPEKIILHAVHQKQTGAREQLQLGYKQ